MKSLIIAEKPSVANDIAKSLGGFTKSADGVFERTDLLISCAVGHLVGIEAPEAIANKTPVIPERFEFVALPKTKDQLNKLVKLMNRSDVDTIVNACDAGREGELIFRRIYGYANSTKTIKRMWLQSMTPQAIKDSHAKMRSDAQMRPLSAAAFARSEADWIVGVNGSRFCKRVSGEQTPVGRVQTPTLMIVVDREEAINTFVAKPYFEVHASIALAAGTYIATWTRPAGTEKAGDPRERIWERAEATAIVARCSNKNPDRIIEKTTPSRSAAPALFDLTSLQREANRLFGMSASDTLKIAQALYQTHKVLTYPRTDAKALPEDYIPTVTRTVEALASLGYETFARRILDNGWIKPSKKIFDNSKISDHFAIIPTGTAPRDLSAAEQKIFDLVARRLLAVFHPDAEYAVTVRTASIGSDEFVARGKVLLNPGWRSVYQGEEDKSSSSSALAKLPLYQEGELATTSKIEVVAAKTKGPTRFNEASLLSAMEHAGRDVEDDALREAMGEKGLGTPATRAATIEGLITDGYMRREAKTLFPTEKAFSLKALLIQMGASALLSAELTGEWESQLKAVELGQAQPQAFMEQIKAFTLALASQAGQVAPQQQSAASVPCPTCAKPMRRIKGPRGFFWGCSGYDQGCKTTLPDENGKPGAPRVRVEAAKPDSSQPAVACEKCGKPMRRIPNAPKGPFWGCTGYSDGCRFTLPDEDGKPAVRGGSAATATPRVASAACGAPAQMTAPVSSAAPAAKPANHATANIGDKCPECSKGHLTQRVAKPSLRPFAGCTAFPTCRYFKWLPQSTGGAQ